MEQENDVLKRLENEDDEPIAQGLAEALSKDNVEKFLQLYDEIPTSVTPERLDNIKEMARQVAALTRTSTYRHGPMPGKDSTYFGINHSLQTSQLTLSGSLGSTDFSAFKTPPEGCTPVDPKNFDYEEETLKNFGSTHSLSLNMLFDGNKQRSDSSISNCLSPLFVSSGCPEDEKHCKLGMDESKTEDDAFHTPPEYQDDANPVPPFGFPPSSEKLITSVINLLSKTEDPKEVKDSENSTQEIQDRCTSVKENPETVSEEKCTFLTENGNSEDSLDGSPRSRRSFVQEEDDSGISTVDENDVSRDSPTDNGSSERKVLETSNEKLHLNKCIQGLSVDPFEKRASPSQADTKHAKSNHLDSEDGLGWQTRYKRIGRKRNDKDFERRFNYDAEFDGQNERSNPRDFSRRGTREGRHKDKNMRIERVKNFNKKGERFSDDSTKSQESNAWTNRKTEDSEFGELLHVPSSKGSGHRGGTSPHSGGKSEARWCKKSSREKYSVTENKKEGCSGMNASAAQSSVFSYRDALLKIGAKVSMTPDTIQSHTFSSKADKTVFDVHSATSYLSSVWTSVTNLHRKDPSKVFIYSDD